MKVNDIIAACNPEWMPGSAASSEVEISIILPTFRRGQDGLFLRAARSVLQQSFRKLELIVVDDASIDGTAKIIEQLMKDDGRVSCIRHRENMGLPAISEYEAYTRSAGSVIGFAFDDFVFEQDSIGQLLSFMHLRDSKAVHGLGKMFAEGHDFTLGDSEVSHDALLCHNFIANGAVLLRRHLIEEVGLYDPHVVMARLCDWDLWRRLRRKTTFDGSNILMGREHGASRTDSLGNTYPVQFEVIYEFMGQHRDELLRPLTFGERDVLACPDDASYLLRKNAATQRDFFSRKSWFPKEKPNVIVNKDLMNRVAPRKTATVVAALTASHSLYWIGEIGSDLDYVSLIDSGADSRVSDPLILKSDLVVFVREIMEPNQQRMLELCRRSKIPHVYFLDDNFPLLARTQLDFVQYRIKELRQELASFLGVITSSKKLENSLREMGLHQRIDSVKPLYIESQSKKLAAVRPVPIGSNRKLVVACFGGMFRTHGLLNNVVPALNSIESESILLTREISLPLPLHTGRVEHQVVRGSSPFFRFLKRWRKMGPNVVAHPAGRTENIDFKSENAIVIAAYLGAVPIVTWEEAYQDFDQSDGVEKIKDTIEDWTSALNRLANQEYRMEMVERLRNSCRKRFSGSDQIKLLNSYFFILPELGADSYEQRFRLALSRPLVKQQNPDEKDKNLSVLCGLPLVGSLYKKLEPAEERGWFEQVHHDGIASGWAFNGTRNPVDLVLEIDNLSVGKFIADQYRGDLLEAGIGEGYHGFRVKLPQFYFDGQEHTVSIKFYGSGHEVQNGSQMFRLG